MLKRHVIILLGMLLSPVAPADDVAVSIGIGTPHASIGIHIGDYPRLVAIPGYPVYYAPRLQTNFFFYDGMYWVFQYDNWYASYWYDGPWSLVSPYAVPVYLLRVPVRYYRYPPPYFRGWKRDAPPHWENHWGRDWERRRSGWDRWDHRAVPPLAPLPAYQRRYAGDNYPRQVERQRELHQRNYRYQPRESVVRQRYQERYERNAPRGPAPSGRPGIDDRRMPPPPPQRYQRDPREYRDSREYREQREFRDQRSMREPQGQRPQGREDRQRGRGPDERGRDQAHGPGPR